MAPFGKYTFCLQHSTPDVRTTSRLCTAETVSQPINFPLDLLQTAHILHSSPGRAVESLMRSPHLSGTSTSSPSHRSTNTCCSHQSRPGAGVGDGGGVSQTAPSGKYQSSMSICPPDGYLVSSKLRIYYQNVRGLRTKIDALFLAVTECDYDIIVLTETWLDDEILSPQLFGSSYRVFRNNRNEQNSDKIRGGGVLIAVSIRMDSIPDPTPVCATLEQLWVRVTVGAAHRLCIGAFYLPPDSNRNIDQIESHINSIGSVISRLDLNDSFIQFGGYNQPGLKWIPSEEGGLEVDPVQSRIPLASSYLIDGFNLHGLTQINSYTNVYGNCLDLVLVNDVVVPNCVILEAVEPLVPLDIAHPALEMEMEVTKPMISVDPPSNFQQSYNFRKADYTAIAEELKSY